MVVLCPKNKHFEAIKNTLLFILKRVGNLMNAMGFMFLSSKLDVTQLLIIMPREETIAQKKKKTHFFLLIKHI